MHRSPEVAARFVEPPLNIARIPSHVPGPARQAETRLKQSSHAALRRVRCDFHEGVLTLRGRVSSYYLKQLAQTLTAGVKEVQELVNRIEVRGEIPC